MPITSTDIKYRLSGGAANTAPLSSLGGAKSSTDVVSSTLFDTVTGAESAAGDIEYRCVYVHNAHATLSLQSATVWIATNTTGDRIAIGIGSSAVNGTEQTVANESTAPTGVTFSQPGAGAGLALGTIPAGQHRAVWIRRTVAAGSVASNDTFTLSVQGDTEA